jgi:hypothetical protein
MDVPKTKPLEIRLVTKSRRCVGVYACGIDRKVIPLDAQL